MTGMPTRILLVLFSLLAFAGSAHATFHLWRMTQFYSNADGTVQYIELIALAGSQQFLSGHTLTSTQGSVTHSYNFTTDLPGDSAMTTGGDPYYGGGMTTYKSMVIGTQGFAALGILTPDYVVPNGFLFTTNGTINYAGQDVFSYAALPTDGRMALDRGGSMVVNSPMNFAGMSASIVPAAAALNVQGLWWRSPAASEGGWGINVTHQGDLLFATWFTYDTDGSGMWLVMPNGVKTSANTFTGTLYRTTGPAFSAAAFDPSRVVSSAVGSATFSFSDAANGTFTAVVNGAAIAKPITREVYAASVPTCTAGGNAAASANYQDLWWRPGGAEAGWGMNITHQGDVLFVTWFTYDTDGKGMWLVGSNVAKTGTGAYAGKLYRTTGPAFNTASFDPSRVAVIEVGTIAFTFGDGANGSFSATVNGVAVTKPITREVFASPASVCN